MYKIMKLDSYKITNPLKTLYIIQIMTDQEGDR